MSLTLVSRQHSLYQQQPRTTNTAKMQQQLCRGGQGALSRPVPSQQRVRSCLIFVTSSKPSAVIEGCSCPAQVAGPQHHRRTPNIVVTRAAAPQTVTAEEFIEVRLPQYILLPPCSQQLAAAARKNSTTATLPPHTHPGPFLTGGPAQAPGPQVCPWQ